MIRKFPIIAIFFLILQIGCKEETTSFISEKKVTHFRVINIIERSSNVAILGNEQEIIDTLFSNHSSGYIDIGGDSLQIEILDNYNNQAILYDTLCYIEKDRFYTLFLLQKNNSVSSLLVQDSKLFSPDCSFIRIFNNSAAGEPFSIWMNSQVDTISFISLPLYSVSSNQILLDTLYTPSLSIISSGLSGEYDMMSIELNKQYLLIITDTFHFTNSWYPYVLIVFEDIMDSKE